MNRKAAMPHTYSEQQPVEQLLIGLFAELGWATVAVLVETFVAKRTSLRETRSEGVLVSWLRGALEGLNLARPPEAITAALDELPRDGSAILKYQIRCFSRTPAFLLPLLLSVEVILKEN